MAEKDFLQRTTGSWITPHSDDWKREAALSYLVQGYSIANIATFTHLSVAEVERIAREMQGGRAE